MAAVELTEFEKRALLARKISEIAGSIESLPKDGFNERFNYHFTKASTMVAGIRDALNARSIAIFPDVLPDSIKMERAGRDGSMLLTTLVAQFDIIDGETGYMRTVRYPGSGSDNLDKGSYKAMTGAYKYMLEKLFNIATVEEASDPEDEVGGPSVPSRPAARATEDERVAEIKRRQAANREGAPTGKSASEAKPAKAAEPPVAATEKPAVAPAPPAEAIPPAAAPVAPVASEAVAHDAPANGGRVLQHPSSAAQQTPAPQQAAETPAGMAAVVLDVVLKTRGTNPRGDWEVWTVTFDRNVATSNGKQVKEALAAVQTDEGRPVQEKLLADLNDAKDDGKPRRITIDPGRRAGSQVVTKIELA